MTFLPIRALFPQALSTTIAAYPALVILRCSPFFTASLEGCGRKRKWPILRDAAQEARLLRMTVVLVLTASCGTAIATMGA
jgi:hypothetical protein